MHTNQVRQQQTIRVWTATVVTCLAALGAVLVLDQVAPMFIENSLAGFTVRLALTTLCLLGFIAAHRRIEGAH